MSDTEKMVRSTAHNVLRMEQNPLEVMFKPKSVAVVGATERPGSVARTILWNLISTSFGGTIFPVNPKYNSIPVSYTHLDVYKRQQHSWGGNSDVIPVGGLSWDDHINLPEAGNYTLRLVICFDGPACQAQNGTWHSLSPEIPVTIQ